MKIVIDISDLAYKAICEAEFPIHARYKLVNWIKNGTPLPKGHGRLIDADAFTQSICTYQQTGCGDCKHSLCCPENAPTIIEADKEGERE